MKIVMDKRIPGLEPILGRNPKLEILSKEGADITPEDVKNAEVLFVRTRTRCDSRLLEGSGVRLLGTATIGTDHIDIPWCKANGISVVNAPGCNAPAVMQYVATTLHAAGFDPGSEVLGVVGKGHIGSLVTDLYRSAGTRVLVCDPPRKDCGLTDEEYLQLEEILDRCDAVTFHVPYTVADGNSESSEYPTHHLLTRQLLANHQRPRIIVNASRGLVVEPDAIRDDTKKFIIDTCPFEDEPDKWTAEERQEIIESAFIATPHIAGYSIEGKQRATDAMARALQTYMGETPASVSENSRQLHYDLKETIASFNPMQLSQELTTNPENFEKLRASHLRPEPPENSSK